MMSCASRLRAIRLMEALERMHESGSDRVVKEDGTTRYYDSKGNVMIEARMKRKGDL